MMTDKIVVDQLKQDLEECLDDKESVASETHTLPEATALEDVQSNLIENKREVLSEGGQSAGDHAKANNDDSSNEGGRHPADLDDDDVDTPKHHHANGDSENQPGCTCGGDNATIKRMKPVDVIRILGEGSQGIVALCRYREQTEEQRRNDNIQFDGETDQ